MNNRFAQLPKYLQWIFTGAEIFVGIGILVALSILTFGAKKLLTAGDKEGSINLSLDIGEISFSIPPEAYSITSESFGADEIIIEDAIGNVSVRNPQHVDAFLAVFIAPTILLILFGGTMLVAILECFRRLFRNVRQGESFHPKTVSLLHKLGGLIILMELGATFGSTWVHLRISQFLRDNLQVEGLETEFLWPASGPLKLGFGAAETTFGVNIYGILAGFMVIAIGEAFRQGMLLKQEHELTI